MQSLEHLRIINADIVLETIRTFPKDLDESYERIINGFRPLEAPFAARALRWLCFARRPLFIEELVEASMVDATQTPPFNPKSRLFEDSLLELLSSLIQVDSPIRDIWTIPRATHRVSLAHSSVQSYLRSDRFSSRKDQNFFLNKSDSHLEIAKACLAYLTSFNTFELRSEQFPLRSYTWTYWAMHICLSCFEAPTDDAKSDSDPMDAGR